MHPDLIYCINMLIQFSEFDLCWPQMTFDLHQYGRFLLLDMMHPHVQTNTHTCTLPSLMQRRFLLSLKPNMSLIGHSSLYIIHREFLWCWDSKWWILHIKWTTVHCSMVWDVTLFVAQMTFFVSFFFCFLSLSPCSKMWSLPYCFRMNWLCMTSPHNMLCQKRVIASRSCKHFSDSKKQKQ